ENGVLDKRDRQRISHGKLSFARKDAAVHVSLPSDSIVKQRIQSRNAQKRRTAFALTDLSRSIRLCTPREAREVRGQWAAEQRVAVGGWCIVPPLGACQHVISKNFHASWRDNDQPRPGHAHGLGHTRAMMSGLFRRACSRVH
ncbi:MAG: hypothetical protein ACK4MV_21220, partial [Beijerinckiaceae bacterium]